MGPETVAGLGDNFGAVGGFIGGLAKGSMERAQARALELAGAQASAEANQREEQIKREGRQTIGEQIAASAQAGTGFGPTTIDAIKQSEANLSLDAMIARYQGLIENINDQNKATAMRHQAAAEPFIGAVTGAAKAIGMAASMGRGGSYGVDLGTGG